jgi:hypothetical protein
MARTEIPLDSDIVEKLAELFNDGQRSWELTVGITRGGLRVVIFADEHPPPHFRVEYQGENASFTIMDCQRLRGNIGLERFDRHVRKWWVENRALLIEKWNKFRPIDCPVGPI